MHSSTTSLQAEVVQLVADFLYRLVGFFLKLRLLFFFLIYRFFLAFLAVAFLVPLLKLTKFLLFAVGQLAA